MIGSLPGLDKLVWLLAFSFCFWTGALFALGGAACFLINKFISQPNLHLSRIAYGSLLIVTANVIAAIYFAYLSEISGKDLSEPEFYLFFLSAPALVLTVGGEITYVAFAWLLSNSIAVYFLGCLFFIENNNLSK